MAYEFKFSVLMPIYNVEKYLAEAIDSLINQSIGFEENIELVIVDDGSPDNSKDIALKYQEKYHLLNFFLNMYPHILSSILLPLYFFFPYII